MTISQYLELLTLLITLLGIGAAIAGTMIAYKDFKKRSYMQSIRALHETQLRVAEQVLDTATAFEAVETFEHLYACYNRFSQLKHGKALALLDKDVLDAMVKLHNAAVEVINSEPKDEQVVDRVREELLQPSLVLSHTIRCMLAKAFEREAECRFTPIDVTYTQEWE